MRCVRRDLSEVLIAIELDVRTLTLSYVMVAATFGVGLLVFSRLHPQFRGVRTVAIGFLAVGLGMEFIGLRGEIPLVVSIPVANGLIAGGRSAVIVGVALLVGAPGIRVLIALATIFTIFTIICTSYYAFFEFSVNNRIIAFSSMYAVITAIGGGCLLKARPDYGLGMTRTLAGVFLAISALHLFRLFYALDTAEVISFLDAGNVLALSISISQVALLLIAVGVIWIVADGLHHELRRLARIDPLTGRLNRRAFDERCDDEWSRARRRGQSVSVIAVDIDLFKAVNDTYGHDAGDVVLQTVAGRLRDGVRAADIVARFGGEEFVVLLPDTERADAGRVAEKLRAAVAAEPVTPSSGPAVRVTASFGVSGGRAEAQTPAELLKAADNALYTAKDAGRNRVIVASEKTG